MTHSLWQHTKMAVFSLLTVMYLFLAGMLLLGLLNGHTLFGLAQPFRRWADAYAMSALMLYFPVGLLGLIGSLVAMKRSNATSTRSFVSKALFGATAFYTLVFVLCVLTLRGGVA
ncbi:hypothetical protein [Dokdonella soli]|uniref:Uncharacterized protein n=1 Tax=Dokdonella soli TaxID=529810 RepID=A0ABN1IJK2_9GAMM